MSNAADPSRSVGLVTIATGRYIEFVPALVESARAHLVGLESVFVLTDAASVEVSGDVQILPWGRMEWPLPTLLRYRAFRQYASALSQVDVLLYTDADMLFVGEVDVRDAVGLIAVQHPGFVGVAPEELPYERRPVSTAYVPKGEEKSYFCGGVQGGLSAVYLEAASDIDNAVAIDQERGITAIWHDESQWNRYLLDHPAALELDSSYCTPDDRQTASSKILAIVKDHAYFRELSHWQRVSRVLNRIRFSIALRVRRVWRALH